MQRAVAVPCAFDSSGFRIKNAGPSLEEAVHQSQSLLEIFLGLLCCEFESGVRVHVQFDKADLGAAREEPLDAFVGHSARVLEPFG